jgi:hypothetical protein
VVIALALSSVDLLPRAGDYWPPASPAAAQGTPPVYLVLLDGYPRFDTLAALEIDNRPFVNALARRGFDHYPDATSVHEWTHRTVASLIQGSPVGIPNSNGTMEDRESARRSLEFPDGYVIVDAPVAHMAFRGGEHVSAGGINDFEAHLIGLSVLGLPPARDWSVGMINESLRQHFEGSLDLLVQQRPGNVFAHLMAPHPPLFYAGGVPDCWPECRLLEPTIASIDMSVEAWSAELQVHLRETNARILEAIDAVLRRNPDAVIVLFSDHGTRYGDPGEQFNTFLAARTPGRPDLFRDEPHPHAILRLIEATYQ